MNSINDLVETIPIQRQGGEQLLLRDVADGQSGDDARPVRPLQHEAAVVTLTANIAGEDLGACRAAGRPAAIAAGGRASQGVDRRSARAGGAAQRDALRGLAIGLGAGDRGRRALLLTANFQSVRLALVVDLDGPGGRRRRGASHCWLTGHDAQHSVVHRGDHGDRRGDGQRDFARHVRRATIAARADGRGRGGRRWARRGGCGRS